MAETGGRNMWIAVPAGLLCAAVLGALVWLAIPALPGTVGWFADSVDGSTPDGGAAGGDGVPVDCRRLYNDALWASLRSAPEASLTPDTSPPLSYAPAAAELAAALAPTVRITCTWRAAGDASISTTLADVATDADAIAEATLPNAGFVCADTGTHLSCTRTEGEVVESVDVGGGLWLSSVQTRWMPERYASRVAAEVWQ